MQLRAFALLVAAFGLIAATSRPPAPPFRSGDAPVLPRPAFLHAVFAAQQNLIADYFWILTTHQIGAAQNAAEFRDVTFYADLATDLDPAFYQAYLFAGIAAPVQVGRDQYANIKESTALLEKGVANLPKNYKLKFQLAQNYIHLKKDYRRGADLLRELSKEPEAPDWLPSFATRLYAQSGAFDASLELAKQMLDTAPNDETRAFYRQRLKEIRQELILKRVDREATRFVSEKGRRPKDMKELVEEKYVEGLPADPLGGSYYLDDEGRARSTASRYRLEMLSEQEREKGWKRDAQFDGGMITSYLLPDGGLDAGQPPLP